MKRFLVILGILGLLLSIKCQQVSDRNPYDLEIINDLSLYKKIVDADSSKILVNLEKYIPGIKLDIRYATKDNFTGEKIYKSPKAYLRLPVAKALKKVQKSLNKEGLGLKIYDAYRPYAATLRFYEVYPDTTFVAAPWKGSNHNRGCAVDVTLIDLKNGKVLSMPTAFDDFTEKAHIDYQNLPDEKINNREKLISNMNKYGFSPYENEWWHYDYKDCKDYKLMDVSFEELERIKYKLVFFR